MGPDEFATREELALMLRLVQARIDWSSRSIAELVALLRSKGVLTESEVDDMVSRLSSSPESVRLNQRVDTVRQFAEIHKTARQYLDPPEE